MAIERHVFVCRNERPTEGKPSCGARGGAEVFAAMQREVGARPDLWGKVAITSCGCLGPCFDGPMVVVYPDAVWYAGVTARDVPEVVESHLAGGEPVERLRYPWPAGDDDT
jgi:(2Fe-2S) ferredoxin